MTSDQGDVLSRREIQDRASRGALWTALQVVVSLPLNVVATVVVARQLDVDGYGELAFLTVVLAVVLQVTDLGFTAAAVQWGSQARAAGDDSTLRMHLSKVTGFHLLVQTPLFLAAAAFILRDHGFGWAVAYGSFSTLFLYASAASLALVLDQRNDVVAKVALTTNVVLQGTVIMTAIVTQGSIEVLVARAAAAALPGLVALPFVRPALRRAVLRPRLPLRSPTGFVPFALLSWGAASVALLVYSRSEIILLNQLSTAEQTALFALAFGVSQQLTGPVDALVAPLIPATAALVAGHADHLVHAIRRAIGLASLLAGTLLAGAVPGLFGLFPVLYGLDFGSAAGLFVALGVVSTLQTATSVVGVLVQAQRAGRSLLLANVVALVVNLAVAVALIPWIGAWGAMVANVLGQVASIGLLTRAATTGRPGVPLATVLSSLRPWAAALPAVLCGVLMAVQGATVLPGVVSAVLAGGTGILTYVIVLRWARWAPCASDLSSLVSTLPGRLRAPARTCSVLVGAR